MNLHKISITAMLGLSLCLGACATVPPPSLTQLAPLMRPYIDDALTRPMSNLNAAARYPAPPQIITTLNPTAHQGPPEAKFELGLALKAGRNNFDEVPQPYHATLVARSARLNVARGRFRQAHPDAEIPADEILLPPLPVEQEALAVEADYTTADIWLNEAKLATISRQTAIYVPPVRLGGAGSTQLITLSSQALPTGLVDAASHCVEAVRDDLDAESFASQLFEAIGPEVAKADGPAQPQTKSKGQQDGPQTGSEFAKLVMSESNESPEHKVEEAKCGGADAFVHYRSLVSVFFTPSMTISVSTTPKADKPKQ